MVPSILAGLVVIVCFRVAAGFARKAVTTSLQRRQRRHQHQDAHVELVLGRFTFYGVMLAGFIVGFGVMGIHLSTLMTTLGLVGFAVGFAFQGILSNFLAGILLMLQRPYTVGDLVSVAGYLGVVVDIRLRDTVIRSLDGLRVLVPNHIIFNNALTNYTTNGRRRVELPVGIRYGQDVSKAMQAVRAAADNIGGVLETPPPVVLVTEFAESSIRLILRFWIDTQAIGLPAARSQAAQNIRRIFEAEGIAHPFPVRNLHPQSGQSEQTFDPLGTELPSTPTEYQDAGESLATGESHDATDSSGPVDPLSEA